MDFYREKFNVYNFIDVKNGFIIVNIDFKNNNYPFSSPTVYLENKNGAKINYLKLLNYESNKLKKQLIKKIIIMQNYLKFQINIIKKY